MTAKNELDFDVRKFWSISNLPKADIIRIKVRGSDKDVSIPLSLIQLGISSTQPWRAGGKGGTAPDSFLSSWSSSSFFIKNTSSSCNASTSKKKQHEKKRAVKKPGDDEKKHLQPVKEPGAGEEQEKKHALKDVGVLLEEVVEHYRRRVQCSITESMKDEEDDEFGSATGYASFSSTSTLFTSATKPSSCAAVSQELADIRDVATAILEKRAEMLVEYRSETSKHLCTSTGTGSGNCLTMTKPEHDTSMIATGAEIGNADGTIVSRTATSDKAAAASSSSGTLIDEAPRCQDGQDEAQEASRPIHTVNSIVGAANQGPAGAEGVQGEESKKERDARYYEEAGYDWRSRMNTINEAYLVWKNAEKRSLAEKTIPFEAGASTSIYCAVCGYTGKKCKSGELQFKSSLGIPLCSPICQDIVELVHEARQQSATAAPIEKTGSQSHTQRGRKPTWEILVHNQAMDDPPNNGRPVVLSAVHRELQHSNRKKTSQDENGQVSKAKLEPTSCFIKGCINIKKNMAVAVSNSYVLEKLKHEYKVLRYLNANQVNAAPCLVPDETRSIGKLEATYYKQPGNAAVRYSMESTFAIADAGVTLEHIQQEMRKRQGLERGASPGRSLSLQTQQKLQKIISARTKMGGPRFVEDVQTKVGAAFKEIWRHNILQNDARGVNICMDLTPEGELKARVIDFELSHLCVDLQKQNPFFPGKPGHGQKNKNKRKDGVDVLDDLDLDLDEDDQLSQCSSHEADEEQDLLAPAGDDGAGPTHPKELQKQQAQAALKALKKGKKNSILTRHKQYKNFGNCTPRWMNPDFVAAFYLQRKDFPGSVEGGAREEKVKRGDQQIGDCFAQELWSLAITLTNFDDVCRSDTCGTESTGNERSKEYYDLLMIDAEAEQELDRGDDPDPEGVGDAGGNTNREAGQLEHVPQPEGSMSTPVQQPVSLMFSHIAAGSEDRAGTGGGNAGAAAPMMLLVQDNETPVPADVAVGGLPHDHKYNNQELDRIKIRLQKKFYESRATCGRVAMDLLPQVRTALGKEYEDFFYTTFVSPYAKAMDEHGGADVVPVHQNKAIVSSSSANVAPGGLQVEAHRGIFGNNTTNCSSDISTAAGVSGTMMPAFLSESHIHSRSLFPGVSADAILDSDAIPRQQRNPIQSGQTTLAPADSGKHDKTSTFPATATTGGGTGGPDFSTTSTGTVTRVAHNDAPPADVLFAASGVTERKKNNKRTAQQSRSSSRGSANASGGTTEEKNENDKNEPPLKQRPK
ncbi:unnamed protein product [Amoebophrya sp. A120]|nr:unnamed protein product [Amoebophrya sp. A120]|eukprot:GSA120T00000784001.1